MTRIVRSVAAVGIDPALLRAYLDLHDHQPQEVRSAMRRANICSYRMYLMASQSLVISVSERNADTVEADKQTLAEDQVMQDWLARCRPMQRLLAGERSEPPSLWAPLPKVYEL